MRKTEQHRIQAVPGRFQRWIFAVLGAVAFCISAPLASAGVLVTNIASFSGYAPGPLIQGRDGLFYIPDQTSVIGGILQLTPGGPANLFPSNPQNAGPNNLIQGIDGYFYGTTSYHYSGSTNYGTVFRFTTNGTITTLAEFYGTNGSIPTTLVQTPDGSFYGTTLFGGPGFNGDLRSGYGTVFKLDTNGTFSTLAVFDMTNGAGPWTLARGGNGDLYGTTYYGGSDTNGYFSGQLGIQVVGFGTIFRMSPDGTLTLLASLNKTNTGGPPSSIIAGKDGNFYGTSLAYGSNGVGAIFELTRDTNLLILASFDNTNGAYPDRIVQTADGSFYGSCHGSGTCFPSLFQFSPPGNITSIFSFLPGSPTGPYMLASMLQGTNGLFYGIGGAGNVILQVSIPIPPVLQAAPAVGGINLSWNSVPGQKYQAQFSTNIAQTNWVDLGAAFTATNSSVTISNSIGPDPQRIYRVLIKP